RLSKHLEDEDRFSRMLKSAMMYPGIVMTIGIGVVFAMVTFVIPKFESMLKESGQELPDITQFVLNVSHFTTNHIVAIVLTVVFSVVFSRNYFKSDEGKAVKDRMMFNFPIF